MLDSQQSKPNVTCYAIWHPPDARPVFITNCKASAHRWLRQQPSAMCRGFTSTRIVGTAFFRHGRRVALPPSDADDVQTLWLARQQRQHGLVYLLPSQILANHGVS